jgi:MYXO-CTERM domain-containing protein
MRDTCSFAATSLGMTFITNVERGPDNALYITASDPMDAKIYKSTDDGMTVPTAVQPSTADAWWQTLKVAPSDGQRVYLTGYRLPKYCNGGSNDGDVCIDATGCPDGTCETVKEFLLFRSDDGGATYDPMSMTGISPTSTNSAIEIAGIDPTNADIVYARVTVETGTAGESIYKSTDGGDSWTKILSKAPNVGGISFVVRSDHSCVAGTRDIGSWVSTGCDATWTELPTAPHIGCLYENTAHEVWACTQNTASVQLDIPGDGWFIMKSSDLSTWTGVLGTQNIVGPESCAAGTVQQDRCVDRYMGEQSPWCCLVPQLGLTSTEVSCEGYMACFGVMPDETVPPPKTEPGGCCSAGGDKPPVLLTLLVGLALLVRRRRRA